jgi:lysophospholipase L1-like esterase
MTIMSTNGAAIMDVLYVVERDTAAFQAARIAVDIVCAGDSLTGWNNFGPAVQWPYRTYPDFLQELCDPLGLRVANGGIAGEISDNGPQQVRDYLELLPNAPYFVFGMGTNDLGTWPDTESTSRRIIGNLGRMAQMVLDRGKQPILFNVPHVNERAFPPRFARDIHAKRDYHNPQLKAFCDEHGIPLADICSLLQDEHFGDELHPNDRGAKIIAEAVFQVLPKE